MSFFSAVIDNEFPHYNIVKVVFDPHNHSYFDNVMTKPVINNWIDA